MKNATAYRLFLLILACSCVLVAQNVYADPPPQCFEVQVIYEGREFLYFDGQYNVYRWSYRVVADTCITNALSNWVLEVCDELIYGVTDVSTMSVDSSDPAHGDTTYYGYEVGMDHHSGILGVKWEFGSGNELDTAYEYDTFSFISPGLEKNAEAMWQAKDGRLFDAGTTIGPGCEFISVDRISWGSVKAHYRR